MACFIVPVAEAVITTVIIAAVKAQEAKLDPLKHEDVDVSLDTKAKTPFSRKLKWLSNMLWGGSALLAFEHVWHGEVTPWFPFLTATASSAETTVMLHEMATTGVAMAALITAVWGVILLVTNAMEKRALKARLLAN